MGWRSRPALVTPGVSPHLRHERCDAAWGGRQGSRCRRHSPTHHRILENGEGIGGNGGKRSIASRDTNPHFLRNPIFCVGCFEFCLRKNFATAPEMGKNYFVFATAFCGIQFCGAGFGRLSPKFVSFLRLFLRLASLCARGGGGGYGSFTLVPLLHFVHHRGLIFTGNQYLYGKTMMGCDRPL